MGRKCKVCGETMQKRIGEHHGDLGQGVRLYRDVRQYVCRNECSGPLYDFSRAVPADEPIRIFKFIKAPKREVNVIDPLLSGGIIISATLMILAFLVSMLNIVAKIAAITLVTTFAVMLMRFMSTTDDSEDANAG